MSVEASRERPVPRRTLLLLAGAGAAGSLLPAPTATAAPAQQETVAGQVLVAVPADPDFVFTADLSNNQGAGEASAVDSAYRLGAHQVTNAQYAAFLAESGHGAPPEESSTPSSRSP